MAFDYHKRRFPEDVAVYIEEYNKDEATILFDFFDSNEYGLFTSYIQTEYNLVKPSMVLLRNYRFRNIQENTIYAIKKEVIISWIEQNAISINEDSFLIGFTIDMTESENEVFSNSITLDDFIDWNLFYYMWGSKNFEELPIAYPGRISFTVRNVGQGNWNEVKFENDIKLVYDAGAPMYATKSEVIKIIADRVSLYSLSKPGLILSHWDKDHYHALLGMADEELSNFSFFLCRDQVPNLTSRKLFNRISSSINNTYTIPAVRRNRRRGGPTLLIPINETNNQIVYYNSEYHKNRNISGLLLTVRSSKNSVVFTGDAHYTQISRDILNHLRYKHKHFLIVPHHGGNAGKYIYNFPISVKPGVAIVSCGNNHYGHPYQNNIAKLIESGFSIQRTDYTHNDITIRL